MLADLAAWQPIGLLGRQRDGEIAEYSSPIHVGALVKGRLDGQACRQDAGRQPAHGGTLLQSRRNRAFGQLNESTLETWTLLAGQIATRMSASE